MRATAIRLALDLASEVRGQLPAALQWALSTRKTEETYVRRIGAQALVAVFRGEDAVYARQRPGTALGVPCGLDLDEPLLGRTSRPRGPSCSQGRADVTTEAAPGRRRSADKNRLYSIVCGAGRC